MAFKRASNILKQAGDGNGNHFVYEDRLSDPSEIRLSEFLKETELTLHEKRDRDDFEGMLKTLTKVKPHLDLFFEKVMVMAADPSLRQARLSLLGKMVRLFKEVADLSEIQGASPNK